MVVADFFGLDETEYAFRISKYETARLREQEITKYRQQISAGWTIGTGLAGAIFTGGVSLGASLFGARRLNVAERKLELIEDELINRGEALHEMTKRDWMIPLAAGFVTLGVGCGVETALQDLVPIPVSTNTLTSKATESMTSTAVAAAQSFAAGAEGQVHATVDGMAGALNVTSGTQHVLGAGSEAFAQGAVAAAGAETKGMAFGAGLLAEKVLEYGCGDNTASNDRRTRASTPPGSTGDAKDAGGSSYFSRRLAQSTNRDWSSHNSDFAVDTGSEDTFSYNNDRNPRYRASAGRHSVVESERREDPSPNKRQRKRQVQDYQSGATSAKQSPSLHRVLNGFGPVADPGTGDTPSYNRRQRNRQAQDHQSGATIARQSPSLHRVLNGFGPVTDPGTGNTPSYNRRQRNWYNQNNQQNQRKQYHEHGAVSGGQSPSLSRVLYAFGPVASDGSANTSSYTNRQRKRGGLLNGLPPPTRNRSVHVLSTTIIAILFGFAIMWIWMLRIEIAMYASSFARAAISPGKAGS